VLVRPYGTILRLTMLQGGGSTFGVMTSVTLATHPTPKIVAANIVIASLDLDAPFVWEMVGYLLSQFPYLDSQGVSGYSVLSQNYTAPTSNNGSLNIAGLAGEFLLFNTKNVEDMQAIWDPIITYVKATWPTTVALVDLIPYPSFASWFDVYYDQDPAGYDEYIGSHLLDAPSLTSNRATVGQAFETFKGEAFLVAGKGTRDAKPRGGSTAVNPSWRKTIVHAGKLFAIVTPVQLNDTLHSQWLGLHPSQRHSEVRSSDQRQRDDRASATARAYYGSLCERGTMFIVNSRIRAEANMSQNNPSEPNWQYAFWGENYERLLQIKRAVDPNDVLWCHPCVGNERWEYHGYQLCPVDGNGKL
jgi:hypothetical protein